MSELIRHPAELKKVQDEIRTVVGTTSKDRVQHDDMPKLKYLRMVVKETLRLHPPATLLVPRQTTRQIKVGGYDIPANTKVIVNAWAIGRDPSVWGNPDEFRPGRFEGSDIDFNGAHFELVPFGAGRRICPGLAMGVANVEFILANLLCCFDWELPHGVSREDVSMEEAGSLTFHKKIPLVLVPARFHSIRSSHG
jgi:4-hydroxyphenylacetaldehyde oxime monooxygenase